MTATLLSLLALFLSGFVIMLGNGLINILLPTRLNFESVSTDSIGLIMSMFSVGLLLGGIYTRRLIIRVGHIRVYATCAAMAAISILTCYLWLNEWLWAVMRILMGFCIAAINVVADGWLSERATSETRARILATNQIVLLSAMFIGSFMINLAAIDQATLYILAGVLLCGGVIPIAMSSASAPEIENAPAMPIPKLIKASPVGVISVLICGMLLSSLLSMLAVYAQAKSFTGVELSLLVGAAIIGGVILQFPIGYLADRFERRIVMLYIMLASMLCSLVIPFVVEQQLFVLTLILVSLSSGVISSLYPLGIAETFDRLQQNEMSLAIGGMIILYAIGGIIGPYSIGLVMEHIGIDYFFTAMAITQLLFALFVFYRTRVRRSIPIDQQETFVAQGAAGWISTELDPRIEYIEAPSQSPVVQTALELAAIDPKLALEMVSLVAKASPDKVIEVAGALAGVEGIDASELYQHLNREAPEQQHELLQAIITETPDSSAELINTVFDQAQSEDIAQLAASMTEVVPEQGLEIIEAATDAVLEDNPEVIVDIAERYLNNVTDSWEDMRYADRLVDDGEQSISDMVSMIAEKAPEQMDDISAVMPREVQAFEEGENTDSSQ